MIRVGQGVDVHPFKEGRPLVLGGVTIPHDRGLDGHSDADAVIHALCDALLGTLALGDIGHHFPPSDPRYKGKDSRFFLREVAGLLRSRGYSPHQVDITILAERPRISPHIPAMTAELAACLGIAGGDVSIKATTTERMGFTGREEGIAVWAVATVGKMASP
uniref:2-C-methyl-D-erythritol 2,4-cyclodiphosphate synthase n=1 Tax=Leptospirillum ferrodiazotrophum TaxID=412449 RepID=C6I0F2_9BACT|nr:MAG: 2C-methyl-D-erythritol 2,4-cyclodiphosphate synthase [Leptospirillum ferrodiazotrophum]